MKKIFLFIVSVFAFTIVFAQDFSNKGKDFWVGYGSHVAMYGNNGSLLSNGGAQEMVLYFTSDVASTVTVTIPATGWTRTYSVIPNTITESDVIPKSGADDARLGTEGVSNKGIHVESTNPIVAYAHIYNNSVSGATLLFPTNTLGQDYYTLGFTQVSNSAYSYPFCFVIATEDNTVVEITPSANTQTHIAGVAFTQTLQKGQILNLMGQLTGGSGSNQTGVDLTGTRIRTISSGTSTCKRIAVFSGSGKINIQCGGGNSSADNYIQQCFPSNAWGKKYLTVPTKNMNNNFFRIMVKDPATIVKLNGTVMTGIVNNRYYQFNSNTTNLIEADQPIMVAQFITTANACTNTVIGGNGDPEMIYLSSVEQTINKITLNSTSHFAITSHFINASLKTNAKSTFKLDGVNMASSFIPFSNDPNYSYAQFSVSSGIHNLTCDSGFNAIAYGYGSAESYGYNAGTNVVDLYQYVTLQNQYATVNFPATCKNTPFYLSLTLPYLPTSMTWDFNNNPNMSPNTNVVNNSPVPDSTFVRDGRTLYVFKLPSIYQFTAIGTYPIKVTVNNPTTDGCSGLQEINYDVVVYEKPVADFTYTHSGCVGDAFNFFDNTNGFGRPTYKWAWDFGDGSSLDSTKNPIKTYASVGTGSYNVHFTSITDIGCISDTTKTVYVTTKPNAKFGMSDTTCIGKTIAFTDSSTIVFGTLVKWYWDYGDGTYDTLTTNLSRIHTYYTAGTYTASLIVESNTGCKSIAFTKTFIVHVNPIPDFSLPIVCLPIGAATFINNTTISDGTLATITYQWNFGDGGTGTSINGVHNYTSTGPFSVKLTATSQYGCIKDSTKTLSTVYVAPQADFSATSETCLRDSTTFTDLSTPGTGNTITNWYWNRDFAGAASYVDTAQSFKYRYGVAKTYTVKMYYKTDKGCISDTATKTLIVNPLPTASFTNSTPLCELRDIQFNTTSVPNAGYITRWYWNMGNSVINNFNNNSSFTQSYTSWNNYTVKHMVETDKGCKSDTTTKVLDIRPLPHVGFILPEVCLSDANAVFTDTSSIADGSQALFTYKWQFNITTVSPGPTPPTSTLTNGVTKYNKSDNYQVRLTVTSGAGCVDSLTQAFTVNGSIPKADFVILNENALCSNLPVQIQNTSTVDFGWLTKLEIYWDFAGQPSVKFTDQNPQPNQIYSFTYPNFQQPATKPYSIRLVAYSGGICSDPKTKTVTLNASPKTQFITMPGICLDALPRQITQASEIGGVTGASPTAFVYYGTGVNSTGLFTPTIAGVGTFPIKYIYTSNIGCKDSSSREITVWPSPEAKFGISTPVCEKNAIIISDSSKANFSNIVSWNYDFGDGTTLVRNSSSSFPKTYILGNSYYAKLVVITDSGCVSPTFNKTIKVNYLPIVDFSLPDVCLPDGRATFNNNSTIPDNSDALFTYLWNFGDLADPTPSVLKNPTHKYTALAPTSGYQVKLKITSKDGCIDSLTKSFAKIYPQPKADFNITPTTKQVCIGDTLYFIDNSRGLTSAVNQWYWRFSDNTISNIQNPKKVFADTGRFGVNLFIYNTQGCVSDTLTDSVTVHPYPKINAGPDLFVLEGGTVQIKPTYYATNPSFLWKPSVFLDYDTVPYPKSSPPNDTTYIVKLTGIGGCSVSDDVFIKVLRAPIIPNVFSPNGDGKNDTWYIEYLDSYPGATIEVFDRGGNLIYRSINYKKQWDGTYNGKIIPVGTYYYIIDPKNGRKPMSGSVTILR